jgi:ribosome-binding protein aMBF1 (putative translation factor)
MAKTSDALKIIDSLTGDDSEMENLIRQASLNAIVAQLIYEARTDSGLTQKQLADRVSTKQSAIAITMSYDF